MKLTTTHKESLVREIRFATENMKKSESLPDKMFFFSAVYGALSRIFNDEFDPSLVFIHQVVRQTFDLVNAKVNIIPQRKSISSGIPANLFDQIEKALNELADKIEKGENYYKVLESFANFGYSVTGNGSYLYFKGMLKI